jgi:nitrate reductase NapE component
VLLIVVLQDAFEVMLPPRRVRRRFRLTRFYFDQAWAAWCWFASCLPKGMARERFLSVFGALSMIVLFALWATALIGSFGTLEWLFQGDAAASPIGEQIYMSGVTFFTLGYGDVVPLSQAARIVTVIEAEPASASSPW